MKSYKNNLVIISVAAMCLFVVVAPVAGSVAYASGTGSSYNYGGGWDYADYGASTYDYGGGWDYADYSTSNSYNYGGGWDTNTYSSYSTAPKTYTSYTTPTYTYSNYTTPTYSYKDYTTPTYSVSQYANPSYSTPTYSVSKYATPSYTVSTPKYKVVNYSVSANVNTNVSTNNPVTYQPTCTIYAVPTTALYGGSATLYWSSSHATNATLTDVGNVGTNGSQVFNNLNATKTYTLTVSGNGGSNTCSTTVTVNGSNAQPHCTLTANPNPVYSGNNTTLSWTTTNASSASIDSIGSIATGNGSRSVQPGHDRTYTMTVWNSNGQSNTCSTYVDVANTQSSLWCSISVQPQYVTAGGSAVLTWDSGGATNAWLSDGNGMVSPNGNKTVYPNGEKTYTLTVSNGTNTEDCSTTVNNTTYTPNNPTNTHVWLTQLPYTGFDFGFWGNLMYWMFMLAGAAAASYAVVVYRGGVLAYVLNRNESIVASEDDLSDEVADTIVDQDTDDRREGPGVGDSMVFENHDGMPRLVITRGNGNEDLPGQN